MWSRLAALAVLVAASCASAQAQPPLETLSLDDAFARVASTHPNLRLIRPQHAQLEAGLAEASLRPPLTLGVDIENTLGSGTMRGFDQAELTLSLAGVLERGGKLDARRALAQTRIDALAVEREGKRLDLLAETARRYLAIVAARQRTALAEQDIAQRRRTVAAARQRLAAGASPESVVLTAQAALARAEMEHARARQQEAFARQHLAALWGERDPSFEPAPAEPRTLPAIADLAMLSALLEKTPELLRFNDARRIAEARMQLARTQDRSDLAWQFGIRRLQDNGDAGLMGSISIPLGSSARAQPAIRAAGAELELLSIERESQELSLYSTLVQAHGDYRLAQEEVARFRDDILPKLAKAEAAAERAYRAGAISYLEWAQLQSERTEAGRQQLEAALQAQRTLIELQRLTGDALLATTASQGDTP